MIHNPVLKHRQREQRSRLILNFLMVLRLILAVLPSPGHVHCSLHRQRSVLREMQACMTHNQWVRSFRMHLHDVQDLFQLIAEKLQRNVVKATNSSGSAIAPECRVLMVLRWCEGGSYLDCMELYCISKAAFFENLWLVLGCIAEALPIVFDMDTEVKG